MATDEQVTRVVRSWLEDGRTALPDRVLDAVLADLPATPQRRSWWPPRRYAPMHVFVRWAAAAAAVVLVALVGLNLFSSAGPGGAAPTMAPTASPSPDATPTPIASLSTVPRGEVPAGRYRWPWPGGGEIALDIPAGWTGGDGTLHKYRDTPGEVGLAAWLPSTATEVSQVYDDACAESGTLVPVGPSTADLVAALDAQVGTNATVTELQVGGYAASRVDLVVEPGLDTSTCRQGADGPVQVWFQDQSGFLAIWPDADGTHGSATVWSVDVDGDRLVFTTGRISTSDAEAVAEVEAMVDSMAIAP